MTGRRNFLFANTPPDTQASGVICSLTEPARETELEPLRYLTRLLTTTPALNRTVTGRVGPTLPANAPIDCRII